MVAILAPLNAIDLAIELFLRPPVVHFVYTEA
jgi:hypothetical protein